MAVTNGMNGHASSSDLEHQVLVVLVTGASSGNGRGIALAVAQTGAFVVCADLSPGHPGGETPTHELIQASGGLSSFHQLDVTKDDQWERVVNACRAEHGHLDVLVNNAGILGRQLRLHEMSFQQWQATVDVNLTGPYLGMKHVLPLMLKSNPVRRGAVRGKIINIASNGGTYGVPKSPAYTASKAGLIGLTKQAAVDYSRDGININSISPGLIQTPMSTGFLADQAIMTHFTDTTPAGRVGLPRDVAASVLFLMGEGSDYCYGTDLVVDGGYLCT